METADLDRAYRLDELYERDGLNTASDILAENGYPGFDLDAADEILNVWVVMPSMTIDEVVEEFLAGGEHLLNPSSVLANLEAQELI